jgi:hypothetical protein
MPATKIMLIRHAEKPNGDAGLTPEGPDRAWLDPRQRAGRPVRSCEWSCPAAAAREADQSLRLGIGKPAPQADDRAVGRGAQSPGHDVAEGPRGRARGRGQGGRRSGSRLLAARGDPRDRDADPGRADGIPPVWPGHRFDLVWVFDLNADGTWSFVQAPQLLLPGDSGNPIGWGG